MDRRSRVPCRRHRGVLPRISRADRGDSLLTPLDEGLSATLVANVAFALSLIVLFALTTFERGSIQTSRRAVLLFACLPRPPSGRAFVLPGTR